MKKRYVMMLAGSLCLATSFAPISFAEEATTEAVEEATEEAVEEATEEAADEAEETAEEAEEEAAEEAEEEAPAEEAVEEVTILPRPDIKLLDFVTLGEYTGLTVSVPKVEITDEEVEETFQNIVDNYVSTQNLYDYVEEGTLAEGDTANIDYVGKKDGVAFDGGTASGYDLTLGSGTFIPGFEEGLIGVEVGESVEIPLTFPEQYHSEELAGQDVIFEVKVNSIRKMPEFTDEMASDLTGGEFETVDGLKEQVRTLLIQQVETNETSQIFSGLMEQIHEGSEIGELPEEYIDYELSINKFYVQQQAMSYGMTLDQFVTAYGMTMEQFEEQMRATIEESVWQSILPLAIAEAEEMTISEEEYNAKIEELAAQAGQDAAQYAATLEERYPRDFMEMSFLVEKVQDFLKENNNIDYTEEAAQEVVEEEEAVEEAVEEEEDAAEEALEEAVDEAVEEAVEEEVEEVEEELEEATEAAE